MALPCPAQPGPALPCPALPCPALSRRVIIVQLTDQVQKRSAICSAFVHVLCVSMMQQRVQQRLAGQAEVIPLHHAMMCLHCGGCMHAWMDAWTHKRTEPPICLSMHPSFIYAFAHSAVCPCIYSSIHPFAHSFICSFMHSSIHSSPQGQVQTVHDAPALHAACAVQVPYP